MKKADTISKQLADPDGLDFASLRRESITAAQELSGKIWTDYNLHDPGVTIIEQVCYALTELAYQAAIPVPDRLADRYGQIDYHRYGLLKPHEIFPSGPVTPDDYSKLLIDAVPEIERIQFQPILDPERRHTFRYRATIRLCQPLSGETCSEASKQDVIAKVRDVYACNRNVGEDLAEVVVEDATPCFLSGSVEATGKAVLPEVHAEIFFRCARRISSNVALERYEDVLAGGARLEDVFSGPLTQHGHIREVDPGSHNRVLAELNGLVMHVPGVRKVSRLRLVNLDGSELSDDDLGRRAFYLKYPEADEPVLLVHYNASHSANDEAALAAAGGLKKYLEQTRTYLQKLEFAYRAFRENKQNAGGSYELPKGKPRQTPDYYSLQNQFPNIYGINENGVPVHQSQERRVYARQLKAYLYPVEQVMANFGELLQTLQEIFALDADATRAVVAKYLGNDAIPGIEELYCGRIGEDELRSALERYRSADDRKNRALDTLLALYGEEFTQDGLLAFNYYHVENPGRWTAANKVRYLRHIGEFTARRSGAFNVRERYWDTRNQAPLVRKLCILLGIENHDNVSTLAGTLAAQNVRWVGDAALVKSSRALPAHDVDTEVVPSPDAAQARALDQWRRDPDTALSMSPALLAHGVHADAYRLSKDGAQHRVYVHLPDAGRLVLLSSFPDREKAIEYAHKFRKIVIDLNVDSEGLYLVEHQLLRPRSSEAADGDDAFFASRVSCIFPGWSARFASPAFRRFAQKTVSDQLPAHVMPDFHWLDPGELEVFESRYQQWLDVLLQSDELGAQEASGASSNVLDSAAAALVEWLQAREPVRERWV
ncbi:MAG: hypothetical protein ACO1PZ_03555 [Gammaproteobacteria bacterium]